jgi:enamine deaminase RidA (YjgF/YER057c/UK114 family)
MATNRKALERQRQEKVEYDWGTLWPHYHKEKMNWATGFRTKGDVDILFLSGSTGRDPFEDGPCRTPDEERAGKGKVVGGIKEQTRQTLEDIKNSLELMGATLKHIVMFRYFLKRREDVFDMRDEMYKFFEDNEPDLRAHPRPATLIRGVGIDLPDMLVEIEAWPAVPRKNKSAFCPLEDRQSGTWRRSFAEDVVPRTSLYHSIHRGKACAGSACASRAWCSSRGNRHLAKSQEARRLIEVGIHDAGALLLTNSMLPGTAREPVQIMRGAHSRQLSRIRISWRRPKKRCWQ